jgi:murein DD-endopeptidase MepM/ murein hydrolase activator NlpD
VLNIFKKYKLILIDKEKTSVKEINSRKMSFLFLSVSLLVLLFLSILFFSKDFNNFITLKSIQNHQDDNKDLQIIIDKQSNKISLLLEEIELLNIRDNNIRKLLKLPVINDDVRKLGVGGSSTNKDDKFNELEYLLPKNIDLSELNDNIYFLQRSVNLGKLSYSEIEDKANSEFNYFTHYPAIKPVSQDESKMTSGYGYRYDPFTNKKKLHEGDDFSAKRGTEIIATADGIVKTSRYYGSFGNYIEIDHGNGYITCYGHLHKRNVKKGQKVERGQLIGQVGNTGRSTASHLHYEIKYKNKTLDPSEFYFDLSL